jgi:hypothetical protein
MEGVAFREPCGVIMILSPILDAMRTGLQRSFPPYCMSKIHLTNEEKVVTYVSSVLADSAKNPR